MLSKSAHWWLTSLIRYKRRYYTDDQIFGGDSGHSLIGSWLWNSFDDECEARRECREAGYIVDRDGGPGTYGHVSSYITPAARAVADTPEPDLEPDRDRVALATTGRQRSAKDQESVCGLPLFEPPLL